MLVAPKVSDQQRLVLEWHRSRGKEGSTDSEGISHFLPTWPSVMNAYRARRGELVEALLLVKSKSVRIVNGRKNDVWVAREFV